MPIIARKTCESIQIYNNEKYIIKTIKRTIQEIVIKSIQDDTEKIIKFEDFQTMFYLNFCSTIHKNQGTSIKEPYTIHEWNHPMFNKRLKYVALSRATCIEHINISKNEPTIDNYIEDGHDDIFSND
jgi:ATP-dependent exoDNAse (exonuclease V) alpha subunit